MLTLEVLDDGSLKVTSDDKNAENIRVQDALDAAGFGGDLKWADAKMDAEGLLSVIFDAGDEAAWTVEALEDEFPHECDEAYEALKAVSDE